MLLKVELAIDVVVLRRVHGYFIKLAFVSSVNILFYLAFALAPFLKHDGSQIKDLGSTVNYPVD